jgi:hypothetical protein
MEKHVRQFDYRFPADENKRCRLVSRKGMQVRDTTSGRLPGHSLAHLSMQCDGHTLDVKAKVSGRIAPGDLRTSLTKMLDPLGLTVAVRDEVVFVTPRSK